MSNDFRMTLRMPTYLKDWLKSQAGKEGRNMTSQILETLKEAKKIQEKQNA